MTKFLLALAWVGGIICGFALGILPLLFICGVLIAGFAVYIPLCRLGIIK